MLWTVQEENTCLLFRKFKKYGDTVRGVCVYTQHTVVHVVHRRYYQGLHTHTQVMLYRVAGSCTE